MSFNVSALSAYVDQKSQALNIIQAAVAGGAVIDSPIFRIVENVKAGGTVKLYVNTNTVEFQSTACLDVQSGSTEYTTVDGITKLFASYETLCGQDIASKYPHILQAGAESLINWPEAVMNNKVELVQNAIAKAIWQAGYLSFATDLTITSNGYLQRLINTSLSASTYTVNGTGGAPAFGQALTVTNAVSALTTVLRARPASLQGKLIEVHMAPADLELVRLAYIEKNYYNFKPGDDMARLPVIGISNAFCVADPGLEASKAWVAAAPDTLAFLCDLRSDDTQLLAGYTPEFNRSWLRMQFALGVAVLKASEIGTITFS